MNFRVILAMLLLLLNIPTNIQTPQAVLTVCPAGPPDCDYTTIQAAVDAASNGDSIHILTQPEHTESGILLDKDLTVFGDGAGETFVQAAISPSAAVNRVFDVTVGAEVLIRDLTVQHGNPGSTEDGGCIYIDGGELTLLRANVWECEASYGGGIYNAGRLVVMDSSIRLNNGLTGAGGIFNSGFLSVDFSQVDGNIARISGGGIINNPGGNTSITNSTVSDNLLQYVSAEHIYGGGIYNLGTLYISESTVSQNEIDGNQATDYGYGGGIYSNGEIEIHTSNLRENSIHDTVSISRGGGIMIVGGTGVIRESKLESNSVGPSVNFQGFGGGATVLLGDVQFSQVTIEGNSAVFGGGLTVGYVSSVTIADSVFSANNAARSGGGLFVSFSQGEGVKLVNVTVTGNQVNDHGGGIYVSSTGVVNLANVTITENIADADADGYGHGGGVIADVSADDAGLVYTQNSILAANLDLSPGTYAKAPDCDNTLTSQGYNLIGNLGLALNGTHCIVEGDTSGNLIGGDPDLGPLQDNGGPTLTHALNPDSEAINAGDPAGCVDFFSQPLRKDQRGALRENRCDMGAYEFGGLLPDQYLPLVFNP